MALYVVFCELEAALNFKRGRQALPSNAKSSDLSKMTTVAFRIEL